MPTSKVRKTTKKTAAPKTKAVTSAKAWKKSSDSGAHDLPLPSGNVARVRRPGLQKMLAEDVFPDAILGLAENAVQKGKGKAKPRELREAELKAMISDRKKRSEMLDAFDRVTAFCVVEPPCRYHRYLEGDDIPKGSKVGDEIPESLRDEDVLYTDVVDLEDKAHIFDFATGGSPDVEQFRGELDAAVERIHSGEDVEGSSE